MKLSKTEFSTKASYTSSAQVTCSHLLFKKLERHQLDSGYGLCDGTLHLIAKTLANNVSTLCKHDVLHCKHC